MSKTNNLIALLELALPEILCEHSRDNRNCDTIGCLDCPFSSQASLDSAIKDLKLELQ